ncbi:MAG: hypothetical protein GX270_12390 [Clostridiaceae bacterium]|jgi:hypothetical protein|nr:hypothetical protein [Clostridiaceae bacterium]
MLRKLFISLLILSALTSDNIINLTEILSDPSILTKEVIDIVLGYEGELTAKQRECLIECLNEKQAFKLSSASFSNIKFSKGIFISSLDKTNIQSLLPASKKTFKPIIFITFLFIAFIAVSKILKKDIILCHSDISPPLCYN